jgi:hypothetical protein
MPRNWNTLNRYARRDYKFIQRDSYADVSQHYPSISDGVCLGVVMNWIREKLTTSNGLLRFGGGAYKEFANSRNPLTRLKQGISPAAGSAASRFISKGKSGERNRSAMAHGAASQRIYQDHGNDAGRLGQELGLIEAWHYTPRSEVRRDAHNLPDRLHAESIRNAALELPRGSAVLIEVVKGPPPAGSVASGAAPPSPRPGHALAFYRSRGNTLYFFDPNAGVYEVIPATAVNILGLVNAWLDVYLQGDNIAWQTPDSNWYRVYSRSQS